MRAARHSAVELVRLVAAAFPGFRDEAVDPRDGRPVFFYKRAQILVGDLWAAFGRRTAASREAAERERPGPEPTSEPTSLPTLTKAVGFIFRDERAEQRVWRGLNLRKKRLR